MLCWCIPCTARGFQVQAKIATMRPVFPDYLSVFYEYELMENIFVYLLIFWETSIFKARGYLKLYAAHSRYIFCRTYLNTHISNYKIKWKKRSSFERLCFWYDASQQTFTCSNLTTEPQEQGVKTIQDVQDEEWRH